MQNNFQDFLTSLSNLDTIEPRQDLEMQQKIAEVVAGLRELGTITRDSLAVFLKVHPEAVPIIAACAGLGQEQLKNQLRHHLGTSGWVNLQEIKLMN
ncbi:hypothetical protein [Effusibacillus consociatus]